MIVRLATLDDSEDVFLWRNDATTRAMFASSEEISWLNHKRWFSAVLLSENRILFIGVEDSLKVGVCRFDIDKVINQAEVSINFNPSARGKKLSEKFLSLAIKCFHKKFSTIKIVSKIKKENIPSIRCFKGCGFVFLRSDHTYLFFELPERGTEH